jgi:hypothetical protein
LSKKNWPNNPIIRCKFLFNLSKFLERDIDLEEEFEEFKGEFERDEVVEM